MHRTINRAFHPWQDAYIIRTGPAITQGWISEDQQSAQNRRLATTRLTHDNPGPI